MMTKKDALDSFRRTVLPAVKERYEQDGIIDRAARAEAWNDYTWMLRSDGVITEHQYETWSNPF